MEKLEKVLRVLEENARISMEDLAVMVQMTEDELAAMLDTATQKGIINGYRTLIDWEKAEIPNLQAVIELRVSPRRDRGFDEVANAVAHFDEVDSVMLMSGGYDLSLIVKGKSFQDIAMFVAKRLSPLDGVLSTATHFVLTTYKKNGVLYDVELADERESQS